MRKKIAKKWAKALRSGDYRQGYGQMVTGEADGTYSFCCLGVLCNLHALKHPEIAVTQADPLSYLGVTTTLPQEVVEWAGMKTATGVWRKFNDDLPQLEDNSTVSLMEANDEGVSFESIADFIEANYKLL